MEASEQKGNKDVMGIQGDGSKFAACKLGLCCSLSSKTKRGKLVRAFED